MVLGSLLILFIVFMLVKFYQNATEPMMTVEEAEEARKRARGYTAWLNGSNRKKIYFPKDCIDGSHSRMVLFSQEDSTVVDCVICSLCTDTLPMPAPLRCADCSVANIDGFLNFKPCPKHDKEPALI